MDVSEKKISIIEWLLKLKDEKVLDKIGMLAESSVDKWDELTKEQQDEINKAISRINKGEDVPHQTVMTR